MDIAYYIGYGVPMWAISYFALLKLTNNTKKQNILFSGLIALGVVAFKALG